MTVSEKLLTIVSNRHLMLSSTQYCLQYSQSFSTRPRTGPTWCNAALSAINAQSHVSSIELVWLCFSPRTPRHVQCTKHSSALTDSKAKTLGSIFGKFNISAAMCRTGNLKTGKSQNHQFSGNKSPGKYTRYTVYHPGFKCSRRAATEWQVL